MLDTVKINHVQHISFTQSRLTDAVSVILSELLSYEHPSKAPGAFCFNHMSRTVWYTARISSQATSTPYSTASPPSSNAAITTAATTPQVT